MRLIPIAAAALALTALSGCTGANEDRRTTSAAEGSKGFCAYWTEIQDHKAASNPSEMYFDEMVGLAATAPEMVMDSSEPSVRWLRAAPAERDGQDYQHWKRIWKYAEQSC